MCDADKVHFDQRHPFAEVLPDTILTILLGLGIFYGYTMYTNPAVDTTARRVHSVQSRLCALLLRTLCAAAPQS